MQKLNGLMAEQIEATQKTAGYAHLEQRVRDTANQQLARLRIRDEGDVQYLRGYLDALEFVLGLPELMMAEGKQ